MKEQLYKFMVHAHKCFMFAPLVTRHTLRWQSNFCHTLISARPSWTFSFTKATNWKCWYQRLMPLGDGGITVELSLECPLNRNNLFMVHKLQHTKRFLLQSSHYRCVTSQTEREEWSENAHAHKTWTPAVSFHVGSLLLRAFSKPYGRLKPLQSFWYTLFTEKQHWWKFRNHS
jgi:hypothetical protein